MKRMSRRNTLDSAGDRPTKQVRLGESDVVVLDSFTILERQRQRFATPKKVACREPKLQEKTVELRRAGAKGQLVQVRLYEIERQIDLILVTGSLVDLDGVPFVERLEIPQLIEPTDAVFERLGV